MLGMACQYDPQQHQLLTPELLHWCRRQAEPEVAPQLFCYRHLRWKTFVIGMWLAGPYGLFIDLLNLGYSLANFNRAHAQEFIRRLRAPTTAKETAKFISQTESDYLHRLNDKDAELTELRERRKYGW